MLPDAGHVLRAASRRVFHFLEQKDNLVEDSDVLLFRRDRVELPGEIEQGRDSVRLLTGIQEQAPDLSTVFQRLEALQGRIELLPAFAIEMERAHECADTWHQACFV